MDKFIRPPVAQAKADPLPPDVGSTKERTEETGEPVIREVSTTNEPDLKCRKCEIHCPGGRYFLGGLDEVPKTNDPDLKCRHCEIHCPYRSPRKRGH